MKLTCIAAILGAVLPIAGLAQTAADLASDEQMPGNVLTYGMGYAQRRYSPLMQINRGTVRRLVPAWSYSMSGNHGLEAQPLIMDGVIYLTDHEKTVAVDAATGKEIWKAVFEYAPETGRTLCCGMVNRGAALFEGKLYRTTLDAQVIALDARTGKEVWRAKSSNPRDGYSMTAAPLVVNGIVITGVAGGEFGARGYLEAYDALTGQRLWRTYTVPEPGQPGSGTWPADSALHGGGATWLTGSYDPELNLVFWGTGNPAPWNPLNRKGDNLYTNSILAVRPLTGEIVWFYQTTPNDAFDYDGVNELVQAELTIDGATRNVIMQANRNGFLYVLERATGKVLSASKFVKVTWADRIDSATGRAQWNEEVKRSLEKNEKARIHPAVLGGKNWPPMSYSPKTGLLYINTLDFGMDYRTLPLEKVGNLKPGLPQYGVEFQPIYEPGHRGYLRAVEPLTGKTKWSIPFKSPNYAGTLVTEGGIVFTGQLTGEFFAADAETGEILWSFQTPSGIVSQPVTWEKDGKQYVTVASGIGGVYATTAGDPNLDHVAAGGTLWTFKLFEEWTPSRPSASSAPTSGYKDGPVLASPAAIGSGQAIYRDYCLSCHGEGLRNTSGGVTFDLRRLRSQDHDRFVSAVLNGKNKMPPWRDVLTAQQIEAVWAYIEENAER